MSGNRTFWEQLNRRVSEMFFQRFKHFGSKYPLWAAVGAIVVLSAILIIPARFVWSAIRGADPIGTSATARPRFFRSDAWFLAALANCGSGRIPLACILMRGDAMNYSVMGRGEVNGALSRLGRAGYVVRHADGTFEVTDAGRAVVGDTKGLGLVQLPDTVESRLKSAPWSPADHPQRAEPRPVSRAEYNAAVESYLRKMREPT